MRISLCEAQQSLLRGDKAGRWRGGGADVGKAALDPTSLERLLHMVSHLPRVRGSDVF